MEAVRIITPVKDSIELTLRAIEAVSASELSLPYVYTVYNDFCTPENSRKLQEASLRFGFTLVNLADITVNPSPNYLLILRRERQAALETNAALCIVESDVIVRPDTLQQLCDVARKQTGVGLVAAVTTDKNGTINYPYLYAQGREGTIFATKNYISFCCTLLSPDLLRRTDFDSLNPQKLWYDAIISRQSLKLGFTNYLLTNTPVIHYPHGSRPWRKLKENSICKYYFLKLLGRLHKR